MSSGGHLCALSTTPNVVVLTTGLTGSSVLTGLLTRAGYWPGDETFRKPDYDTFENLRLVELDAFLLDQAGLSKEYADVHDPHFAQLVAHHGERVDPRPFADFVEACSRHRPWVWKDPRLWLTIRVWARWLDLSQVRFIVLDREPSQAWVSHQLRRKIVTRAALRRYSTGIQSSIHAFLSEHESPQLSLMYEDLLHNPAATIDRINRFLGTGMTTADLAAVYDGRLGMNPHGLRDRVKATLIYGKNFRARER